MVIKKIFVSILGMVILTGCSYVDDTKIGKTEEIAVSSFIQKESDKISIDTSTGVEKTEQGSGNLDKNLISSGDKKAESTLTFSGLSTINATTMSGSKDVTISDTSDKDIQQLINSLFDSSGL